MDKATAANSLDCRTALFTHPSAQFIDINEFQRLRRADINASGAVAMDTAVALKSESGFRPREDHPIGTEHDTCPTADTKGVVDPDDVGFGIASKRPGQTGVEAGRLGAVAALERKASRRIALDPQPRLRQRSLLDGREERFSDTATLGGAVELAGPTTYTSLDMDGNYFHTLSLCSNSGTYGAFS